MMKLTLVYLLLLSAIALGLPHVPLNENGIPRKRPIIGIYESKLAHIQDYPFTVSLYSDTEARIIGSGTVLNHNWILATTSQLSHSGSDDITIRGGSDDGQKGGQSTGVAKIISNYTGRFSINAALLKTKKKLIFNKKLRPIKLAKFVPEEGSVAIASGFGSNDYHDGVLAVGRFKMSLYSYCRRYYGFDTIVCANRWQHPASLNDLGSPLVQMKQLVAFCSCGDDMGPLTFNPVAILRDWIFKTIKENSEGDEADGIDDDKVDFGNDDDVV